jgi:hypothetical protein
MKQEIAKQFKAADTDGSGFLDQREFFNIVKKHN